MFFFQLAVNIETKFCGVLLLFQQDNEQSEEDVLANRLDHPCKDLPHPTKKEVLLYIDPPTSVTIIFAKLINHSEQFSCLISQQNCM